MSLNTSTGISYTQIKKYVINLDHATERLAKVQDFFGDNFIRVSAVNGRKLELATLDQYFDVIRANTLYQVGITPVQMSCTLSHLQAYQAIASNPEIATHEWVLICEDDNLYIEDFAEKLTQLVNHISSKRFEYAELCMLRMTRIVTQYDYFYETSLLTNKYHHPDLLPNDLKQTIDSEKFDYLFSSDIFYYLRHNGKTNYPFVYSNVKPSPKPHLYSDKQNLFVPYLMKRQSSACYLIRKSTCIRIVKEYPRPFWITDDFKQIIPVQSMLYCSRFLAFDNEYAQDSAILDDMTKYNYRFNRLITRSEKSKSMLLQHCKWLTRGLYSKNFIVRKFTLGIQTVLGLRNQVSKNRSLHFRYLILSIVVLLYSILLWLVFTSICIKI